MNTFSVQSRKGSALVTVMIVLVIIVAAGGAMIGLASQQAYSVGKLRNTVKAQAIAEAGANEAYAILREDFSKRNDADAFPETDFSGGEYNATVVAKGEDMATITCQGTYGNASSTVKVDVKDFGEADEEPAGGAGPPPPEGAYEFAIVAGSIRWSGNGQTEGGGGRIHSNSDYLQNGTTDVFCDKLTVVGQCRGNGNVTITGDAEAGSYKGKYPGQINGNAQVGNVDIVELPDIDLVAYYQQALANGEVYEGYQNAGGATIQPAGGIMWVNGDVHISGQSDIIGCIVATGDIKITGNSDQTQVGDLPAYISRDGDIRLTSCAVHHGLIYAMNGNVKATGGGKIYGSVFCAGEFWKTGGWDVIAYDNSTPPDDPAAGGGGNEVTDNTDVRITCWHQ